MENKFNDLLPSCKEAHILSSEALDRNLTLGERTRLQLHLLICTACTNANAQMNFMRTAMRNFPLEGGADEKSKNNTDKNADKRADKNAAH
jgi:hypothetical protein